MCPVCGVFVVQAGAARFLSERTLTVARSSRVGSMRMLARFRDPRTEPAAADADAAPAAPGTSGASDAAAAGPRL
jgi:hypothetical protein